MEEVFPVFLREGDDFVGDIEFFEEGDEGFLSEEGDFGVGASLFNGLEEGEGHDDVAEPIGHSEPEACFMLYFREIHIYFFCINAKALIEGVLSTPAVMKPEPI